MLQALLVTICKEASFEGSIPVESIEGVERLDEPGLHGIFRDGVILQKQPCNSERDPLVLLICSARAAKN
jgi:hypothetical protein